MKISSSAAVLTVCAVAALAVAGCGSSSNGSKGSEKIAVTLVDSGCTPSQIKVASGSVTFDVINGGTSKVSEMELKDPSGIILGESENVVEGVPGRFSLNLKPGHYIVNCPNGSSEDRASWWPAARPSVSRPERRRSCLRKRPPATARTW